MLKWAQKHKIGLVVSSIAVKSPNENEEVIGIGSTDSAREKIRKAGLKVLEHGTVQEFPGTLLNDAKCYRTRCHCNYLSPQTEKDLISNQVHSYV